MKNLQKLYNYFNFLSLDVVLGSLAGMGFFAHLLRVNPVIEIYLVLGLTVWIIYTLDHLVDVRKTKNQPSSPRHKFHFKYGKPISFVLTFAFILVVAMLVLLPTLQFLIVPGLVLAGVITLILVLLYFLGRKIAFLKEFLIALFYVLGITLAPFLLKQTLIPPQFYLFGVFYFLIAWINLLILSYLDREIDAKDGFKSVVNWITPKKLNSLILCLALIGIGMAAFLFLGQFSYFHIYTSILLAMLLIHIIYFLERNKNREAIRKILEVSFLIPFVVFLF
ncbi:hypothetical protein MM236_06860 [Belliella sp. DSM 107340]|uniref:UbiA prenyltransferase family protein n=1 Tax=Belliella calami TaxID=2923436 RepID=A0ABS9UM61_9BACT|nr:UbiA family prenyltransferase [Belliella calami]MCH7397701.1 hypothetical protein [Belliella calami]